MIVACDAKYFKFRFFFLSQTMFGEMNLYFSMKNKKKKHSKIFNPKYLIEIRLIWMQNLTTASRSICVSTLRLANCHHVHCVCCYYHRRKFIRFSWCDLQQGDRFWSAMWAVLCLLSTWLHQFCESSRCT